MFNSQIEIGQEIPLPVFTGLRVMMLPVVIGDSSSLPDFVRQYETAFLQASEMGGHRGRIGYLTIDEKEVLPGTTHRRDGLHVDGIWHGNAGGWGGGGGWAGSTPDTHQLNPRKWCQYGTGMIVVANTAGMRAFNQMAIEGWPGDEGDCDHLDNLLLQENEVILPDGVAAWASPLCIHESPVINKTTKRQFMRLSLPSTAPWFEGYTENPLGVMPTGPMLARRQFMDWQPTTN